MGAIVVGIWKRYGEGCVACRRQDVAVAAVVVVVVVS